MCFSFLKHQNNKRKQRIFCTAGTTGSVTTYACGVCVTLKTKCFGMNATNEISTFLVFKVRKVERNQETPTSLFSKKT